MTDKQTVKKNNNKKQIMINGLTDRMTNGLAIRVTDGLTIRMNYKTNLWTDRWTDTWTETWTDQLANWFALRQTEHPMDQQRTTD